MFFRKITIKTQLLSLSIFVSLLIIMIGGIGLRNTYRTNQALKLVYEQRVIPIKRLKVINDRYAISISDTLNRVINGIIEPQEALLNIEVAVGDILQEWQLYSQEPGKEEEERAFIVELENLMAEADGALQEVKAILIGENMEKLKSFMTNNVYPALEPISGLLSKLVDFQLAEVKLEFDLSKEQYQYHARLAIFAISFGILGTVLTNFILARAIVRSLKQVSVQFDEMASGRADLTKRLDVIRDDEVGEVSTKFNTFMKGLLALVKRVQRSGIQVTTSATAIASTSKQLERTIHDFGSFTNEVGTTAKEISATSRELVKTMNNVSEVATTTSDLATSGQNDLVRMEKTMSQMEEASVQISSRLAVISEKAANITTVVTTITKIADQTNLLSLNASIEAEKAGEYGLGFAVVAREIRRMADQVALATLDIEQMVKEMKSAVSAGVMEMDKFSEEVRRDVGDVRNIGGRLTQIIEQVQTLLPQFEMVHEGVQGQAEGASQISDSMVQLTDAVEQTTRSLNETNSVVIELNDSARELQKEVSGFKVDRREDVPMPEAEVPKQPEGRESAVFVVKKRSAESKEGRRFGL